MIKPRTLLVWPNPFHALDHEGRPAGVLSYEPTGNGSTTFDSRRFIGADLKATILEKAIVGTAQQSMQRTWFEYLSEPVTVPESPYYKHAIARGEIFAADEETARRAGITLGFVEPGELLERAKAEVIDAYERNPPHEDLDGLAPDELVNFTFGPMKVATENRKKAEADAVKALEEQKKVDDQLRADEEKGIRDRAARRAERDDAVKKEALAAEAATKDEAAATKVAADAAAKASADAVKTKSTTTTSSASSDRKGEV